MRVVLQTLLAAPPERVWVEVNRLRLLHYVSWPLIKFQPVVPVELPAEWQRGEYEVKMQLFGIVPIGRQYIVISHPTSRTPVHQLLDDGRGPLISRWHHLIQIEPYGTNGTRYTDDLDVCAGVLTPFVWLYAQAFFAHRQRRWRKLVKEGFSYQ